MSSPTHRLLCWLSTGLLVGPFVAVCSVAASFPESRPWIIQSFWAAEAWLMASPTHLFIVLGAVFLVGMLLLWGILKTADPSRPPLHDLAEILRIVLPQTAPPPVLVEVDSASHVHTASEPEIGAVTLKPGLLVNEQKFFEATLTQHPPTFPEGLYVGMVIVAAARLVDEENSLEIAIRAFNGTGKVLRMAYIEGTIRGGQGNLRDLAELPAPVWKPEHTTEPIAPYAEFMVVLDQRVSPKTAADYLRIMESSYVLLDLRALNIVVEVADNPASRARLPLWDGVTIRRRDDIFTGRNTIVSAVGIAAGISSATAVGEAVKADEKAKDLDV